MDIISKLPSDVIYHIVSFLSAKDAARTQLVSKNLKNHITIITNLVLHDSFYITGNFKLFMNRLLPQHVSYRRIKRLFLNFKDHSQYNFLVKDCLSNVLNSGLCDVELEGDYSLPLELFSCKTVEKLKLGSRFVIEDLPEKACLPSLKTLILGAVRFVSIGDCVFTKLMSACPVLQELTIVGFNWNQWKWSCVVSSPTLKRLTLRRKDWDPEDLTDDLDPLSFDTPNLTYFRYTDIVPYEYSIVNLNSLVEARIKLIWREDYIDATNLIKGLSNVQILSIEHGDTAWLFRKEPVPVFENMSHLSISTERELCWDGLKLLVTKSPNLKTLTIQELHEPSQDNEDVCECLLEYSFLKSSRIEVLKITKFEGGREDMMQFKHILSKLPSSLKLLEVHIQTSKGDDKRRQIANDLLKLTGATSKSRELSIKFPV